MDIFEGMDFSCLNSNLKGEEFEEKQFEGI